MSQPTDAAPVPEPLRELLRRIRFFYDPREVWMFGSQARGDARKGSDWDILVVVDDAAPEAVLDPAVGWRLQRGSGVHADIVCYRGADFDAESRLRNTLAYEVVTQGGRKLDAAAH
jgi:predicted nucleotidyltransferase